MNSQVGFTARACVLLALGAITLSSCGGGGSPADMELGPQIGTGAPEMTITPPESRAPQAIGTIPVQTLTAGGSPIQLEIAHYFQDPDNDPLTYSAESSDPGSVRVGMSSTALTLTPVSAGEATVTVTASDGRREATQAIAATVLEPAPATSPQQDIGNRSTESPAPTPKPGPEPPAPQPRPEPPAPHPRPEPTIRLTGIDVDVRSSSDGRSATLTSRLVPEGAKLTILSISVDPYYAGEFRYLAVFGNARHHKFICATDFRGAATITFDMQRTGVATSVQFTCR